MASPPAFLGIGKLLRHADWSLTAIVLLILGIGLLAVWSFSPEGSHFFVRQAVWVGVGLAGFAALSLFDYRMFRSHGAFLAALYLLMVALLASLLAFAPATRGVRAWFQIGGAGIQPVEPAKLVLALVLAKYFSRRHVEIARLRHLLISGLYTALAVGLVLLQPDFGSAMILAATWLAVVLFSGIRVRHLALFFALAAIAGGVAWFSLFAPYQKARIISFFDPARDPQGAGYNTIQAMVAAGSGQLWGKGIGYGTQSHLNFLPEAETDFIFSAFAEETGFLGSVILLGLFAFLFWRVLATGVRANDNFSKLYVIGFAAFMGSGLFIHIGMNLGLLPVTGIGLPLVSYGGSSLVTTLAGLGIVQSINMHSRKEVE